MIDAIKLIISRSPAAGHDAMQTLKAVRVGSPMAQIRYQHLVELALADPQAEFTPEERAVLADPLEVAEESARSRQLPAVRLTQAEYDDIVAGANESGQSISEHVRSRLFPQC